jgi:hypothetical protein
MPWVEEVVMVTPDVVVDSMTVTLGVVQRSALLDS